jgi:phosphoribosyl-ATP pyrophosphohydrolase
VNDSIDALVDSIDFSKSGGVVPTIVCDWLDRSPRMLAYSTRDSLELALELRAGIYWSRSRKRLWRKGETSGHVQRLVEISVDCDRDALVFYVEQAGPTCHLGAETCFAAKPAFSWATLLRRVGARARNGDASSYTVRLLNDAPLLEAKLSEEALELAEARSEADVRWECADLLYFMTVKMVSAGIDIGDVMAELEKRAR